MPAPTRASASATVGTGGTRTDSTTDGAPPPASVKTGSGGHQRRRALATDAPTLGARHTAETAGTASLPGGVTADLLQSIVDATHTGDQSDSLVHQHVELLAAYFADAARHGASSKLGLAAGILRAAVGDTELSGSIDTGATTSPENVTTVNERPKLQYVRFFPQYGCILVGVTSYGCRSVPTVRLRLLAPDEWAFATADTRVGAAPPPGSMTQLVAGEVSIEQLDPFILTFDKLFIKAKTKKGGQRSAATGDQGHQKTPNFILAVLQDAIEADTGAKTHLPKGGMTDVGLHTGGQARSTAWPLAAALARFVVEHLVRDLPSSPRHHHHIGASKADPSFEAILAEYVLWLAECSYCSSSEAAAAGPAVVDVPVCEGPTVDVSVTARLLTTACDRAATLALEGYDTAPFAARAEVLRRRIDDGMATRLKAQADRFKLPPLVIGKGAKKMKNRWKEGSTIDDAKFHLPTLELPDARPLGVSANDLDRRRALAQTNLSPHVLPGDSVTWKLEDVVSWAKGATTQPLHRQAIGMEAWVLTTAIRELGTHGLECDGKSLDDVARLGELFDAYKVAADRMVASSHGRLDVELKSRRTLVGWAIACIVDLRVCEIHPELLDFDMALDFADLRHLSLSDGLAHRAMLAVTLHLRKRTHNGELLRPVFSLRPTDVTTKLTTAVGTASQGITAAWKAERANAAARVKAHWAEVQKKQKRVAVLRLRRVREQNSSNSAYSQWNAAPYGDVPRAYTTAENDKRYNRRQRLEDEYDLRRWVVDATDAEIKQALKAPTPVVQPLPNDTASALAVLCFLYMPPALDVVARLSFAAQALLRLGATEQIPKYETSWPAHHERRQNWDSQYRPNPAVPSAVPPARPGSIGLRADWKVPESDSIGPRTVDSISEVDEGVWHPPPDLLLWCKHGNPFAEPESDELQDGYTARLADPTTLQWVMPVDDRERVDPTRGNVALAKQEDRPQWLTRSEYIMFCNVRAFPRLQIRKIASALHSKGLPFARPEVQLLLRQALYQVGALEGGRDTTTPTALEWKQADVVAGDYLETLTLALDGLAVCRISDHPAILAVIDTVTYLMGFHPTAALAAVRTKCVETVRGWIAVREKQANDEATDPADVPALRADQCVFAMYGVLAHGGTDDLPETAVADLFGLLVEVHAGLLFAANAADQAAFDELHRRCEVVATVRVGDVIAAIAADNALATTAVQRVLAGTPDGLVWTPTAGVGTGCFEAQGAGHLYSLNAVTGAVLLDGSPPGSLPGPILQHPLYRRVFGRRDFEVSTTASGSYLTTRRLALCQYEFALDDADDLRVYEHHVGTMRAQESTTDVNSTADHGTILELLLAVQDPKSASEYTTPWAPNLPVRIQTLHSHWLDRATGAVVVRPVLVPGRHIWFVMLPDEGTCSRCYRVPVQLRGKSADELIALSQTRGLKDMLVLWENSPVKAFDKIERNRYIHHYFAAEANEHRIELPRFELEFVINRDDRTPQSINFAGYMLASPPQLADTLLGFTAYLVLTPSTHPSPIEPIKVVVPVGEVKQCPGGSGTSSTVTIVGDDGCGARWEFAVYNVHHRFGELRAASTADRLLLAALYAATSVAGVRDHRAGMTGTEMALALLRRSVGNQPLSPRESTTIENVARFAGETAAIVLLCDHLRATANQLAFLHPGGAAAVVLAPSFDTDGLHATASTAYLAEAGSRCNPRVLLTETEERRILGCRPPRRVIPTRTTALRRCTGSLVGAVPLPIPTNFVADVEAKLAQLVPTAPPTTHRPFPLGKGTDDRLSREMFDELRESWDTNERLAIAALGEADVVRVRQQVTTSLGTTEQHRVAAEQQVCATVALLPPSESIGLAGVAGAERLGRAGGRTPPPTLPELMRTLWEPDGVKHYNPFIACSDADAETFDLQLVGWMELCVLEDRLRRLTVLAAAATGGVNDGEAVVLAGELAVRRTWSATEYPQWIAFEVDGGIQVRPAQHAIVMAALGNPGSVTQLNMGLGKTRVIVPLLLLHWRFSELPVRLNLLPALLPEAHEYFHRGLTGSSVFQLPLFAFPFHRDVDVTAVRVRCMLEELAHCHDAGGAIMVAPESRTSLHLKQHELRLAGQTEVAGLIARFEGTPCHDVVDESDEVLRVKFQLIYAVGNVMPLTAFAARCTAVRAVFAALLHSPECAAVLTGPRVAAVLPPSRPGSFYAELRVFPAAHASTAKPLTRAIATYIVERADDYDGLRWLAKYGRGDEVVDFVSDGSVAANAVLDDLPSDHARESLLALRGLLAHDVLWHALVKRARVDYGVAPPTQHRRKRLAVPFRAADTPALRAEFAHPDSALVLTSLAYAYSGLSDDEVLEAFRTLADLNPIEKRGQYDTWLEAAGGVLTLSEKETIRTADKIDLTNVQQRRLLCSTYAKCVPFMHFWLETVVFPRETRQYQQRLKATAWHLRPPDGGVCVGFSGTNDQHRLLPVFAKQHPLSDPALQATNGHMLSMLLERAEYIQLSPTGIKEATVMQDRSTETQMAGVATRNDTLTPTALALLRFAVEHDASALIDAGALLAGVDLTHAATALLLLCPTVTAVVFFARGGAAGGRGGWVVRTDEGMEWPLEQAPVKERDAFVIFDEQHCRGSDMKLKPDALAVLTLGPRMPKDKLMQAAGRLRKLQSQRLIVTALPDVHDQIHTSVSGSSEHLSDDGASVAENDQMLTVLQWVMGNTVEASRSGLHEWSINGAHYCSTQYDVQKAVEDETLDLAVFYEGSTTPGDLGKVITNRLSRDFPHSWLFGAPSEYTDTVGAIWRAAEAYGTGTEVFVSPLDEECEREVEQEQEMEREVEVELPSREPRAETDFGLQQFSCTELLRRGDISSLATWVGKESVMGPLADKLSAISWVRTEVGLTVCATQNFIETVTMGRGEDLHQHLRPIDAMLCLEDGIVLLSDREADVVLENVWAGSHSYQLLHKAFVCPKRPPQDLQNKGGGVVSDHTVAQLQLFDGDTMFGDPDRCPGDRCQAVKDMLRTPTACEAALHLPEIRGRERDIKKSDLEKLCTIEWRKLPAVESDCEMPCPQIRPALL
eukprot:m.409107 g.409107  ORF g.409107 m.409107 type:complete len:3050 (+) comp28456_c0_seq1:346-9495(+)